MKRNRLFLGLAALLAIGLVTMGVVHAALSTSIGVNIDGTLTGVAGLTTPQAKLSAAKTISFGSGVGAGQADALYSTTLSIGSGVTTDVDIKGSLTDALGVAFTPAKVKALYIFSTTCSGVAPTTNLTLFGDVNSVPILNTPATTSTLLPGGMFLIAQPPAAGIAVTAGTGDIIQIANAAGATHCVDLVVIGTST